MRGLIFIILGGVFNTTLRQLCFICRLMCVKIYMMGKSQTWKLSKNNKEVSNDIQIDGSNTQQTFIY